MVISTCTLPGQTHRGEWWFSMDPYYCTSCISAGFTGASADPKVSWGQWTWKLSQRHWRYIWRYPNDFKDPKRFKEIQRDSKRTMNNPDHGHSLSATFSEVVAHFKSPREDAELMQESEKPKGMGKGEKAWKFPCIDSLLFISDPTLRGRWLPLKILENGISWHMLA